EEVDSLARIRAGDRPQNHRLAILHRHAAGGQLGDAAGLDGERASADLAFNSDFLHLDSLQPPVPLGSGATDGQIRGVAAEASPRVCASVAGAMLVARGRAGGAGVEIARGWGIAPSSRRLM